MEGYLLGEEERKQAEYFFNLCLGIAQQSTCYRAKGGSVIVKDRIVIGKGYNSPPKRITLDHCFKDELPPDFKSDRTCCLHAEQRGIINALLLNPKMLPGSRIYYARADEKGNLVFAGDPYCTICSKIALDVGINEFALWHEEGIKVYDTIEYNWLSFKLKPPKSTK